MTEAKEPYIADLHIHSRFSMATSRECDAPHLDLSARRKGIQLIGTGDFTHPAWRAELMDMLEPAEEGLYTLRTDLRLPGPWEGEEEKPRFVLSGEISSIYKKNGRTRKVHNVILLPGLEAAEKLAMRLEAIGNIHSDGRPILGLDSRDLLEITLDACPSAIFIPAHIWTPHFALFGAMSGFDRIEDCFEDLTKEIHALETGLSSDPAMNWRVSALDRFTMVSNSDAHSPGKLGREANLITGELSYGGLKHAVETGDGFSGTLEFFPEEGKYHLDGHRNCGVRLTPEETDAAGGKCPVCGKKVTIGVQHRVCDLADRQEGCRPENARPFESLVPLPEIIAASIGAPGGSKRALQLYERMLAALGPEFPILRSVPIAEIEKIAGVCVGEGVRRLRAGRVERIAGYDGAFGSVVLFQQGEREALYGQIALPGMEQAAAKRAKTPVKSPKPVKAEPSEAPASIAPPAAGTAEPLNSAQQEAVLATDRAVAVIAGPGTGKTKTLVARIAYLIEEQGVAPGEITAVTFTNQAAAEMKDRLSARLGRKAAGSLTVGTFHAICLSLLDKRPILGQEEQLALITGLLGERQSERKPKDVLRDISRRKNGEQPEAGDDEEALFTAYRDACRARGVRDLDDLLLDGLAMDCGRMKRFTYLLVDEYQDINPVQRELVRHWSRQGKSLFVIGDPDQSIYGFRGASAACFDELEAIYPALRRVTLTENYRSSPEIVEAARAVINRNPGGNRTLAAHGTAGRKVRVLSEKSAFSEAVWIAKEIGRLTGGTDMVAAQAYERERKELRAFADIAVLTRTHRQLELIETCLRHDDIPCVVTGRGPELMAESVLGVRGFFAFLLDNENSSALDDCLAYTWRLPKGERGKLLASLRQTESAGMTAALSENGCPAGLLADVDAFLPLLDKEEPRRLLERWGMAHGADDALKRLMDMAVFYPAMAALLGALTLGEEDDIRRASGKSYASGAVRLSTLHGAKGLEFPVVFVSGLTEGTFPMERAGEETDIFEERRLFFVGMTRAKEELLVTGSATASPFMGELPADAVQEKAAPQKTKQLSLF